MSFQAGNTISLIWKKLKKGDYTVRPFEVYKKWEISSDSNEPNTYFGLFDIKVYRAYYPENHKYFGGVANLSSSLYDRVFTTQSVDPKMLWYYLDHNFYTEYSKDKIPNVELIMIGLHILLNLVLFLFYRKVFLVREFVVIVLT